MPSGSVRVSKALTNLSIHYTNGEMIAGEVLSDISVKHESDLYYVYASDRQLPETARANGSQANMVTWSASTSSYSVTEHSLKDVLTDRDLRNIDAPLQAEKHTMENLIDKIMVRQEFEANKLLFTTTTFSNNATLTSATSWRYVTNTSAPIQNILSATAVILRDSGKMPNKVVMNFHVFASLKENQNLHERVKYVQKSILTEELLASLFDVDKVHVGTGSYNPAKEGQDLSMTSLWGADCLVGYFKPNAGLRDVTAAGAFRVKQYGSPFKVKRWREEDVEGNFIEVQSMYDLKAIATSCAYLFKTPAL